MMIVTLRVIGTMLPAALTFTKEERLVWEKSLTLTVLFPDPPTAIIPPPGNWGNWGEGEVGDSFPPPGDDPGEVGNSMVPPPPGKLMRGEFTPTSSVPLEFCTATTSNGTGLPEFVPEVFEGCVEEIELELSEDVDEEDELVGSGEFAPTY